jgi:hypothetical protein
VEMVDQADHLLKPLQAFVKKTVIISHQQLRSTHEKCILFGWLPKKDSSTLTVSSSIHSICWSALMMSR